MNIELHLGLVSVEAYDGKVEVVFGFPLFAVGLIAGDLIALTGFGVANTGHRRRLFTYDFNEDADVKNKKP